MKVPWHALFWAVNFPTTCFEHDHFLFGRGRAQQLVGRFAHDNAVVAIGQTTFAAGNNLL